MELIPCLSVSLLGVGVQMSVMFMSQLGAIPKHQALGDSWGQGV